MKKFSVLGQKLLFLFILILSVSTAVEAKVVKGIILDKSTNLPVPDALVMIVEYQEMLIGAITDSTGIFEFKNIEEAKVKLRVKRVGYYEIFAGPFVIPANDTLSIFVQMQPGAIMLDDIVVEAKKNRRWLEQNGFYKRREFGMGKFIDFETSHFQGFAYATNALRLIPGLLIDRHAWLPLENRFGMQFASSRIRGAGLQVYLDGFLLRDHEWLDIMSVNELAAAEFYPSVAFAPMEFRSGIFHGGVLVIWTRR